MTAPVFENLVDGRWTAGGGEDVIDVRDPADETTKATDFLDYYAGLARLPSGALPEEEQGLEKVRFCTRVTTVAIGHSAGGAR